MITFTKALDPDNAYDTTNIVFETTAVTLPDILEDFKSFLLACGFSVKGDLVVEDITQPSQLSPDHVDAAYKRAFTIYTAQADQRDFHYILADELSKVQE